MSEVIDNLDPNEFVEWPKMPRLSRECIVTEKIDGTNAQVLVTVDGRVVAGSRTKYITPENDNAGFAKWVKAHEEELRVGLGVGRHYGEWWGQGIQRNYGLKEKRFSLFNVSRWGEVRPACCGVVPLLYRGVFDTEKIETQLLRLQELGSVAAPGFMKPEGIVIYHVAGNFGFKKTLDGDAAKGPQ